MCPPSNGDFLVGDSYKPSFATGRAMMKWSPKTGPSSFGDVVRPQRLVPTNDFGDLFVTPGLVWKLRNTVVVVKAPNIGLF